MYSLCLLRHKDQQYVIMIIFYASVNDSNQPSLVLPFLQCKCVCLCMYLCLPPQHPKISNKHACSSFATPNHQTKCDQYKSVNYRCMIESRYAILIHGCIQQMTVEFHTVSCCICLFLYLWFCFFSTPVDHFTLKVDWVSKDIHVRSSSPCCLYSRSLSVTLASHMSCRVRCLGSVVCLGMAGK